MSDPFQQAAANIDLDDRVIALHEAARASCLSIATLRRRLADGSGPPIVRLSARRIGIRVRDLKAWLDAHTFSPR